MTAEDCLEGWMTAKRIKAIAAKPHASAPNGINGLRLFCKTLTDNESVPGVGGSETRSRPA
jgi:hypothetical protein